MKRIISAFLLCSVSLTALAQDDDTGFRLGLQASPVVSWLRAIDKGTKSDGVQMGFTYGLMFDYNIGANYAFSTGLGVILEGGKLQYLDNTITRSFPDTAKFLMMPNSDLTFHSQLIEIPLSLKFKTNEIGYFTYFMQFGLAAEVALRTRGNISPNVGLTNKEDLGKDVNPFNLSMVVGAGFEYSITGNTRAVVGVNFYNGFLDYTTDNKNAFGSDTKEILNHFALRLGIFF